MKNAARMPKGVVTFGAPTVAGFHFDPETAQAVWQVIGKQIATLLSEQGSAAFEMPRTSAIAHEVGHVIQAAHDGIRVERVEVFCKKTLGTAAWGGWTYSTERRCAYGPDTAPELILRKVCNLIAGAVGECVLDPAGYRDGSSLDETVVAQVLVDQVGRREQYNVDPPSLWDACWRRTAALIKQNEVPARALMRNLDLTGTVRGTPLAKVMAQVQQLNDDVLEVHALMKQWGSM